MSKGPKITMTLDQLRMILVDQKRLTAERLKSESYLYNSNSTPSQSLSLPIDVDKMMEVAFKAPFADPYNTLKAYLPETP